MLKVSTDAREGANLYIREIDPSTLCRVERKVFDARRWHSRRIPCHAPKPSFRLPPTETFEGVRLSKKRSDPTPPPHTHTSITNKPPKDTPPFPLGIHLCHYYGVACQLKCAIAVVSTRDIIREKKPRRDKSHKSQFNHSFDTILFHMMMMTTMMTITIIRSKQNFLVLIYFFFKKMHNFSSKLVNSR